MAKDLMASTRVDVDRFDGTGDFSLWKTRMIAHFRILGLKDIIIDHSMEIVVQLTKSQEKQPDTVAGDVPTTTSTTSEPQTNIILDPIKLEKSEKAMRMIITSVGDHVLRKIEHCETAAEMWAILNRLYMESSLPNRIHLQLKFYTFIMNESRSADENVDDFLKIVAKLGSLDVKVSDEVQAILFLTSLSSSYNQLKHTLKYRRDSLTVEEVVSAVRSREREIKDTTRDSRKYYYKSLYKGKRKINL